MWAFQYFCLSLDTSGLFQLAKRDTPHNVLIFYFLQKTKYRKAKFFGFLHWIWQTYLTTVTLTKSWNWFMPSTFVQRWTNFENCRHLCPKYRLILASRWLLTSIIQYTNVILGLKLLTIWTNVTTVFGVLRKIILVLKLLLIKTEVETHTCKLLKKKRWTLADWYLLFCKFLWNNGLSKKWAYLTLKLGWDKHETTNKRYFLPLLSSNDWKT